jgi:hypothetical protein
MHLQPTDTLALALALEAAVDAHAMALLEAVQGAIVAHSAPVVAGKPGDSITHPSSAMEAFHFGVVVVWLLVGLI